MRMRAWASGEFAEERDAALEAFAGPRRTLGDEADVDLFSAWFLNDRALADGSTPAAAYVASPDLDAGEREIAERIAGARLGLYRVLSVDPGKSLELLDLAAGEGTSTNTAATTVHDRDAASRAARWDVLLARVMPGDPPTLWGPVRFFGAAEEAELLAELGRLAPTPGDIQGALRTRPLEIIRFQTPTSLAKPTYFTLEGDPMLAARASWDLTDTPAARERLLRLGSKEPEGSDSDGAMIEVDISVPRSRLIEARAGKELPLGSVVIEAGVAAESPDSAPVATVRIERDLLTVEALSEMRLDQAMILVQGEFIDVIEAKPERRVVPIGDRLAQTPDADEAPPAPKAAASDPDVGAASDPEDLIGEVLLARYRSWPEEPHPSLGGETPRAAVAAGRSAEVEPLARIVENGAARSAGKHPALTELDLLGDLNLEAGDRPGD